jgi:hypothetical protein
VLGKARIVWEPPLWGLYPLDLEERMEIAVGAQTPLGDGTPGLEFEALPGGPVAETVHIGPYAQLPLATTLSSPPSTSADRARKRPYVRPISSGRQRHHKRN